MQNNYIPNIDLSEIISNDLNSDTAKQIAKSIKEASEDIGFFTVTNHGIPISKIENLLKISKKFFYLPEEDKLKIAPKKWNPNTNTVYSCLLYTSPSPRDRTRSRMPSSA